ncbi:hypothetical protein ABE545_16705 [Sphingobacterium faecium]|jgi:hypothetical protein|uniref:hypothetical protein n=1 Tax=Sphingobacterium faecium TaxID=34087 RepID=UPI00320A1C08
MKRLQDYLSGYTSLSEEAKTYLSQNGTIKFYKKDAYYLKENDIKHRTAFLLEGLLCYEFLNKKGKIQIERIGIVHQYIEGTKHPYSRSCAEVAIRFLYDSTVYEINNEPLQQGIKAYPELNYLNHILKQHAINTMKVYIRISNLDREERLAFLYTKIPELIGKLTVGQLCSLLGYTDHRQYYTALRYWHKKNR